MFEWFSGKKANFPDGTEYSPSEGGGYNVWYIRAYPTRFDVLCVRDPLVSSPDRKVGLHVKREVLKKSDPAELPPLLTEFRKSGRFIVQSYEDGTTIIVARAVHRLPDEFKPVLEKIYQDKLRG